MNESRKNRITKLFNLSCYLILSLLIFYILITFFHHYLHEKKLFIVLFWIISSLGVYLSFLISNFYKHNRFFGINDEEKSIKLVVSFLGLTIYCWILLCLAILIDEISIINRYEKFCFWYLLGVANTLIMVLLFQRVYFIKISAHRGFKLWKVYIPKSFVRDEYRVQVKKGYFSIFVMEDKDQSTAINAAIELFKNKDISINRTELINDVKCTEYKGFKYTPRGEAAFIEFEIA